MRTQNLTGHISQPLNARRIDDLAPRNTLQLECGHCSMNTAWLNQHPRREDTQAPLWTKNEFREIKKDGKILGYMNGIELGEMASLDFGEYPAIEALVFVVIEMRDRGGKGRMTKERGKELKKKYAV